MTSCPMCLTLLSFSGHILPYRLRQVLHRSATSSRNWNQKILFFYYHRLKRSEISLTEMKWKQNRIYPTLFDFILFYLTLSHFILFCLTSFYFILRFILLYSTLLLFHSTLLWLYFSLLYFIFTLWSTLIPFHSTLLYSNSTLLYLVYSAWLYFNSTLFYFTLL